MTTTAPSGDRTEIIRPAAMLPVRTAATVLAALHRADVSKGGVWNATASVWQRYDVAWDGPGGSRGNSRLVGTIAVMYDTPARHEVTIYRVTITTYGLENGWTVGSLCDDALKPGGLTLSHCPVVDLSTGPKRDPFRYTPAQRAEPSTP